VFSMKSYFKTHLNEVIRIQSRSGRDLERGLRLDRNERPDNFSQEIVEDIFNNIDPYIFNVYPECDAFYEKLSIYSGLPREYLFLTEGITGGMKIMMETLIEPGDNVIVPYPSYELYPIFCNIYQAEYREVGYTERLDLDIDQLMSFIDDKTKIVFLPNPNQPIESYLDKDQLSLIVEKCRDNNAMFALDECYDGYCESYSRDLIMEYDNVVALRTFSKSFGLAAIRLGYMASNPENIEYLSKVRGITEANSFSLLIAEYILDNKNIFEEYIEDIKISRTYTKKVFEKLGVRWHGGNYGNFITIFTKNKTSTIDLVQELKEHKIYVRGPFKDPFSNCIRITIGSKAIMEKFFKVFESVYKEYV
jgi:histidinol-phosphate aminotransferase